MWLVASASDENTLLLSLSYYGEGNVVVRIPLTGLKAALTGAGIVSATGETQS